MRIPPERPFSCRGVAEQQLQRAVNVPPTGLRRCKSFRLYHAGNA